ncbi:hypothetical protein ABZX95_20450 [Streptomyces sp. NPDC004232]|uniref:hypothetical protein n=1 Tax=Streptomyces sp. NPDC004232 TaxID=3154454 RepID=UPI0033A9D4B4
MRSTAADAARTLADDLRTRIDDLRTRLRETETRLKRLAITRRTVAGFADRLPASPLEPPEHPYYPRIPTAFNEATGPCGPRTSARPSAMNCCRRTSKAPGPS